MNKNIKLTQTLGIVIIALILIGITEYIPSTAILGLLISVPYTAIGILSDKRGAVLSLILTLVVLIIAFNPMYATSTVVLSAIPGILIGMMVRSSALNNEKNKFEPIYGGMIIYTLATIGFFFIMKTIFNTNILDQFMEVINSSVDAQMKALREVDMNLIKDMNLSDIGDYIRNILSTLLLLQGIIYAVITYYITVLVLKKNKVIKLNIPKIDEFYLPGNAVTTTLVIYLLILGSGYIGIKFNSDMIMLNLQLVFDFMFTIQGICVGIFFIKKWIKEGKSRTILIAFFAMFITGFLGISLIGMIDSIIDFRKIRGYKSI